MSMKKKSVLLLIILIGITGNVYGYVDPGTGSYLVQVLIAAAAGAALGIKLFWKKITAFFHHLFHRENTPPLENKTEDKDIE